MGYYSDPTANMAIGNINKEFSKLEKKAKRLIELYDEGKVTPEALERAQTQFKGLYRHVLTHAIEAKAAEDEEQKKDPTV